MSTVVNLSKGGVVNLAKQAPGLTNVRVGLGWDPADANNPAPKKGFLSRVFGSSESGGSGVTIDCDAFAIMLSNGKLMSQGDLIYYGHKDHSSRAIHHCGDNLTGDGDGDDEQIIIRLDLVPDTCTEIILAVNIYNAHSKNQTFGSIQNCFIRLVNEKNEQEICRYNISNSPEYKNKTAVIMGKLHFDGKEWQFTAMGDGYNVGSISDIANMYIR